MWIFGSGFPKSRNLDGKHKGCGTALKPAHEPIILGRKPLIGTVAENASAFGARASLILTPRASLLTKSCLITPQAGAASGRMVFMAAARVSRVPIALRDIRTRAAGPPILFTTAVRRGVKRFSRCPWPAGGPVWERTEG